VPAAARPSTGAPLFPSAASVVDLTVAGSHFDFLGYRWWRSRKAGLGVRRLISPKSEGKLHAKIQPLTWRANGASMAAIVAKLRPVLRGWSGYFQHASANVLGEIDGWVRGRLRAIPFDFAQGRLCASGARAGGGPVAWTIHAGQIGTLTPVGTSA
jgi:hypothetical protein